MPPSTAAAPSSYVTTCASAPHSSSPPGGTTSCRAIWLAIVPDGANRAASCPNRAATWFSSALTVGSSPKTSSPTAAVAIASRIAAVGRVTVSDRRSTTQHLRDQEGQLEALLGVQARVAGRLVAVRQVEILDALRAAEALGDVLAGQLDVDAARVGAQAAVHLEVAEHLVDHAVEVPRLVAVRGLVGVAVHRVALPHHLGAGGGDLLHDRRQRVADLAVAHPADQGEPARDVLGVELLAQLDRGLRRRAGADLHTDRVGDPADEVDVRVVELAGPLADPQEVAAQPIRLAVGDAGQGPVVLQGQGLVRAVQADGAQGLAVGHAAGADEVEGPVALAGDRLVTLAGRGGP